MRKAVVFGIIFLSFLTGCNEKETALPVQPDNLMTEEEFVDFYIDIRLLEASLQQKFQSNKLAKEVAKQSVDQLLEKEGFTYGDFEDNFEYYGMQPEKMYQLFDKILNKLNRNKADVRKNKASENQPSKVKKLEEQ